MKISGTVIEGEKRGRQLGFPTINLDRDEWQQVQPDLEFGIYAGQVTFADRSESYRAGIVIGPYDAWGLPKLEAHLIDFEEDVYGEVATLHIQKFIRPYKDYGGEAELKRDIAEDIATIKRLDLVEVKS